MKDSLNLVYSGHLKFIVLRGNQRQKIHVKVDDASKIETLYLVSLDGGTAKSMQKSMEWRKLKPHLILAEHDELVKTQANVYIKIQFSLGLRSIALFIPPCFLRIDRYH